MKKFALLFSLFCFLPYALQTQSVDSLFSIIDNNLSQLENNLQALEIENKALSEQLNDILNEQASYTVNLMTTSQQYEKQLRFYKTTSTILLATSIALAATVLITNLK